MKAFKILVIIPSFQHEKYLSQCIESALKQKGDFEYQIVITDDCSTDRTLEIAKEYEKRYADRVRVFPNECHMGMFHNHYRALQEMEAEYFCILNGDDYWIDENFLQDAIKFLEANPFYMVYSSNSKLLYGNENKENENRGRYVELDKISNMLTDSYTTYGLADYVHKFAVVPHAAVFRNCLDKDAYSKIEKNTCMGSETFAREEGRFLLYLEKGLAYFKDKDVEVYRLHENSSFYSSDECHKGIYKTMAFIEYMNCLSEKYTRDFFSMAQMKWVSVLKTIKNSLQGENKRLFTEPEDSMFQMVQRTLINKENEFKGIYSKSFGNKNPDKIFVVIYSEIRNWGLYSTCLSYLPAIEFALQNSCIPVIDLKNYYMKELQAYEKHNKENAWEYYYEPIDLNHTLDEVYQSKNVILMNEIDYSPLQPNWNMMLPTDDTEFVMKWHNLIEKYMRLQPSLRKKIEEYQERIFPKKKRVLGVGIRANIKWLADLNKKLANNHNKQLSLEDYIERIEQLMKEWNCDYIFVCVDDKGYLDVLQTKFGDRCLFIDRTREVRTKNNQIVKDEKTIMGEKVNIVEHNMGYIMDVYLLSKCDCLYCGVGSGNMMAYFLNGLKYDHCEIYNEGCYQNV